MVVLACWDRRHFILFLAPDLPYFLFSLSPSLLCLFLGYPCLSFRPFFFVVSDFPRQRRRPTLVFHAAVLSLCSCAHTKTTSYPGKRESKVSQFAWLWFLFLFPSCFFFCFFFSISCKVRCTQTHPSFVLFVFEFQEISPQYFYIYSTIIQCCFHSDGNKV